MAKTIFYSISTFLFFPNPTLKGDGTLRQSVLFLQEILEA
jgi:hypothetical protein